MAVLAPGMRAVLERLAERCLVAIVSGRDLLDVRERMAMPDLVYAGSHGFDIRGPGGLHEQHAAGAAALPALDAAEAALLRRASSIPGVLVERKRFAIAVHYRNAPDDRAQDVEHMVDEVLGLHAGLRKGLGKKVFELRPDVAWDKGRAVLWLLDALALTPERATTIYIGDDVTDEDAFAALAESGRGIGIIVEPEGPTTARYQLANVDDVERFLTWLAGELEAPANTSRTRA
jgi:trehalose-phosphatase